MNSNRFTNIHLGLSQEEAIRILSAPLDQLDSNSDYYMAAAHLQNFPGGESEAALLKLLASNDDSQSTRLAQRKAVEVLAILGCQEAIPLLAKCLLSNDSYLVENAAWALKELNCKDQDVINTLAKLLDVPGQNQRVIIQALTGLGAIGSVEGIKLHLFSSNPGVKGAALAGLYILLKQDFGLEMLKEHLMLPNQMDRQAAIQDIIDANAYMLLPDVLLAPVSPVFRMRAVRLLWPKGATEVEGKSLDYYVDSLIIDSPSSVELVHRYDEEPAIDFLIQEFFGTDFSRCYLALRSLTLKDLNDIWPAFLQRWHQDADNDYGAHYFFMRLIGHAHNLKQEYLDVAINILLEAIANPRPQFLKSKPAAILALANIAADVAIDKLPEWLNPKGTPFWEARYAGLIALERLNSNSIFLGDLGGLALQSKADPEPFIAFKAAKYFG